jgi:transposase
MDRKLLRDDQWARLEPLLPGKAGDRGVTAKDNRLFIEAVLWMARTGAPWRDLPAPFGHWHSVYMRFSRWSKQGVWARLAAVLADDPDLEELFVDSTIVRAHQHAAGAPKKAVPQAIGRSRGGLSTKIHAAVEALGNPLRLRLSEGQAADIREAPELIQGLAAQAVVGDKGYDADEFVCTIEAQGAQAVISPRKNRTEKRDYDRHLYKDRNLVERFFNRIKQFRRLATRYDKLAQNFLSMLHLVCAYIWLA